MKRLLLILGILLLLVEQGWTATYYMRTGGTATFKSVTAIADLGGGSVRATCTHGGYLAGQVIAMKGFTDPAYNGNFTITNIPDATHFDVVAVYTATGTGSAILAGPSSATGNCMSVTTHNAATFSPADVIICSSKGGDLLAPIPPSNGVVYQSEVGEIAHFSGAGGTNALLVNAKTDLIFNRIYIGPKGSGYNLRVRTAGTATFNYCIFDCDMSSVAAIASVEVDTAGVVTLNNCAVMRGLYGVFCTGANSITNLVNTELLANPTYNLYATSSGVINYDHCYFMGSDANTSTATGGAINDLGGGSTSVMNLGFPAFTAVDKYPKFPFCLTFDEVGSSATYDAWLGAIITEMAKRGSYFAGVPTSPGEYPAATLPGVPGAYINTTTLNAWKAAGNEIISHSWSHTNITQLTGFNIQYKGAAGTCAMTISGNTLTTTTGTPSTPADDLSIDLTQISATSLTGGAYTIGELINYIHNFGGTPGAKYTCTRDTNTKHGTHATVLADVAGQAIKAAPYPALYDAAKLIANEIATSKTWLDASITDQATDIYAYPGGLNTAGYRTALQATGTYIGARYNVILATNFMAAGYNVYEINCHEINAAILTEAQIKGDVHSHILRARLLGAPVVFLNHEFEITDPVQVGYELDAIIQSGATYGNLSSLVTYLKTTATTADNLSYTTERVASAINLTPLRGNPVVKAGKTVVGGLTTDITGVTTVPNLGNINIGPYNDQFSAGGGLGLGNTGGNFSPNMRR